MKEENGWEELEMEINDEIKKMAAAYHSMNIPDELKDRVLKSIRKGKEKAPELEGLGREVSERKVSKRELSEREVSKREVSKREVSKREVSETELPAEKTKTSGGRTMVKRILLRTGQTAAAALIAMTVLANSGPEIAYAMERIPVVGAITKVVTFRTYEKQEDKYEARVEVPKVEAESGSGMDHAASELNRSVEEYTDRLIAQFEADVKAEGGQANHGLYSNYEVVADNDRLFTLRINVDEIMASAAGSVKIYNVDKKTDQIITLKDLFPAGTDYVTQLSDVVKEQMKAEMARDENKTYFLDDGVTSDFKAIKEDQNFYINSDGHLVLVFDEYEVAPGYMGVVEIEIPGNVFQF